MKIVNILYLLIVGSVMFGVPMMHMLQTEQFDIGCFVSAFIGFFMLGMGAMAYMIAYIERADFQKEFSIRKRDLCE